MLKKRLLLLLLMIVCLSSGLLGQVNKNNNKIHEREFNIEVGFGYNQIFWSGNQQSINRMAFPTTPTARFAIIEKHTRQVKFTFFSSFNQLGGKSKNETGDFYDEFSLYTIDAGCIVTYGTFATRLGIGIKHNWHLEAKAIEYNYFDKYELVKISDADGFINKRSFDVGFRLEKILLNHIVLSFETWFGITNMAHDFVQKTIHIKQNHFRLLLGYKFY